MVTDSSWSRSPGSDEWGPTTSARWSSPTDNQPAEPAEAAPVAERPSRRHRRAGDAPSTAQASAWDRLAAAGPVRRERGLPGWAALLVLIVITLLGILVDAARGQQLGTGFNVGIIAGSVIGILVVRRSGMFPVVIAPPIVYSLGAGISLYVRSSGLHDRGVLIDAASNWLVYGFPAIAAATASALIIAGIRLVVRR
jgi:hypothetical protein